MIRGKRQNEVRLGQAQRRYGGQRGFYCARYRRRLDKDFPKDCPFRWRSCCKMLLAVKDRAWTMILDPQHDPKLIMEGLSLLEAAKTCEDCCLTNGGHPWVRRQRERVHS